MSVQRGAGDGSGVHSSATQQEEGRLPARESEGEVATAEHDALGAGFQEDGALRLGDGALVARFTSISGLITGKGVARSNSAMQKCPAMEVTAMASAPAACRRWVRRRQIATCAEMSLVV